MATTVKDKNGQPQPVVLGASTSPASPEHSYLFCSVLSIGASPDKDEGVRPETSLEGLAKLKPSFSAYVTTAPHSCCLTNMRVAECGFFLDRARALLAIHRR